MLKKFCKCGRKISITESVCDDCKRKYNRIYDKYKRKNKEIYHSTVWKKLRGICIDRCNGVDLYLYYTKNIIVPCDLVHHIIPVEDDKNRIYDLNNLIALSNKTHSQIHKIYDNSQEEKIKLQVELFEILKEHRGILKKF